MHYRRLLLSALLVFATAAFAHTPLSITPSAGPATGGTEVTITGDFAEWTNIVYFGAVQAVDTRRVDEHTLVARTPPHLPGVSEVRVFEYDMFIGTGLTFTFQGNVPEDTYERVLLPSFTPPVQGAFGSEFHTRLRAVAERDWVHLFGVGEQCVLSVCPEPPDLSKLLDYSVVVGTTDTKLFAPNGTPGRFVYVPQNQIDNLSMNLRVFDVSRSGLNFGTELPVVRESDFRDRRVTLLGVPGDARFRNTLRIYAVRPMTAAVFVNGVIHHTMALIPGANVFEPAYAQIGDLPTGQDMTVTIEETGPTDGPPTPFWAFISATNNETQVITTISPRP